MTSLARQALDDIWAFADLIEFRGGSENFYDLHKKMAAFNCRQQTYLDNKREYRRRLILVPREHRKSTVNTVLYSLWRIYRNPNIRIVVACCVKDLALSFIREIRQYFENVELQEKVWSKRPHIKGPLIPELKSAKSNYKRGYGDTEATDTKVVWSNFSLQVNRDLIDKQPTLQATSVGMSLTGVHCDLLIFDDIVNYTNSDTAVKCQKIERWVADAENVLTKKALRTEISPGFHEYVGNEILINGTRYYSWDYYSWIVGNSEEEKEELLTKTRYSAFIRDIYKNGRDASGGYLCPEIFDAESEADILASPGYKMSMFMAQFRNKVVNEVEDALISHSAMRVVMPQHYRRTSTPNLIKFVDEKDMGPSGPKVYPVYVKCYIDLASASAKTPDKSTYLIGGYDERLRFHLIAARKGKWTPNEHFKAVNDACVHWNLHSFYFESGVGYQSSFKTNYNNWLKLTKAPAIHCLPSQAIRGITKNDRVQNTLGSMCEAGTLYVHSHVYNSKDFKDEVQFWNPLVKNNIDDLLDTAEMVARNTRPIKAATTKAQRNAYRHVAINNMYGGVR